MTGNRLNRGSGRLTLLLGVLVTAGFFWVNIAGFVDTETGSALGCGHNWPLCNGNVIPSMWGLHTIIEFLHRAMVGIVVVLLTAFSTHALIHYRKWAEVKVLIGLSIGFTVLQSFLGALGVLLPHDPPEVLAIHLGVSLMALSSVFLSTVVIAQIRRQERVTLWRGKLRKPVTNTTFPRFVRFITVYTFIAMYIGAYVSSTGDGALFAGWPFPTENFAVSGGALILDVIHRTVAFGLLLLTVRLVVLSYKMRFTNRNLFVASVVALILVCLQAISGMLLIASHLCICTFLSHVTIVSCLFATFCYLCMQVIPEPQRRKNN